MLYTRRGDDGTTKTFSAGPGERITKSSPRAEALGSMDEINSFLGSCKVEARKWNYSLELKGKKRRKVLLADVAHEVQGNLFIVQAELAGADKKITANKVTKIENYIDSIEKELPPIKTFFISGGTELASRFDVARTLARRAERRVVLLHESGEKKVSKQTRKYMNRLSSLLYALARYSNYIYGIDEKAPDYT
ncbi:MAG: cob(I)yrinic acid a,c-diamide adenosyltransferase [Candidatus Campbellbacteria bacterium]|nr:cob(I)yrinic acid a,c-diamide adenosyltransferase [Candidatus Campbellbacteria bacterium]